MPSTPLDRSAPALDLLSVTTVRDPRPGHAAVEVVGEVDSRTAPLLDVCLRSQADRPGLRRLEVRLQQVSHLGAAGLAVLARADRRCRSRGVRLVVLTGGRRCALRPLQVTGLADLLSVDPSDGEPPVRRGAGNRGRRWTNCRAGGRTPIASRAAR